MRLDDPRCKSSFLSWTEALYGPDVRAICDGLYDARLRKGEIEADHEELAWEGFRMRNEDAAVAVADNLSTKFAADGADFKLFE